MLEAAFLRVFGTVLCVGSITALSILALALLGWVIITIEDKVKENRRKRNGKIHNNSNR